MDADKYLGWLIQSVGLENRSARDVVSRTRRAADMIPLDSRNLTCDIIHELGKKEQFRELTATVRSQLRRAIKLYRAFQELD